MSSLPLFCIDEVVEVMEIIQGQEVWQDARILSIAEHQKMARIHFVSYSTVWDTEVSFDVMRKLDGELYLGSEHEEEDREKELHECIQQVLYERGDITNWVAEDKYPVFAREMGISVDDLANLLSANGNKLEPSEWHTAVQWVYDQVDTHNLNLIVLGEERKNYIQKIERGRTIPTMPELETSEEQPVKTESLIHVELSLTSLNTLPLTSDGEDSDEKATYDTEYPQETKCESVDDSDITWNSEPLSPRAHKNDATRAVSATTMDVDDPAGVSQDWREDSSAFSPYDGSLFQSMIGGHVTVFPHVNQWQYSANTASPLLGPLVPPISSDENHQRDTKIESTHDMQAPSNTSSSSAMDDVDDEMEDVSEATNLSLFMNRVVKRGLDWSCPKCEPENPVRFLPPVQWLEHVRRCHVG